MTEKRHCQDLKHSGSNIMTNAEFKKQSKDLNLNTYNYGELVIVKDGWHIVAHIHKFILDKFSVDYVQFRNMERDRRRKFLNIVIDYATTELKDREDVEKHE